MKRSGRVAQGVTGGLVALLAALLGCDSFPYVLHLAEGEFGVHKDVEPIDKVLDSGRLSEEDEAKLRLIVRARDYASQTMGLNAGDSYRTFYDTAGNPLAFNLSAARKDALVARTWVFPFVGEVPYLAFFDEEYLRRVEQQLIDEGYDTLTYELDAYSTLGLLEDPVRSTMLRRGPLSLVETIIHELLHNTIWRVNHTVFNESLATFVGRQGAIEFLRAEYGEDSDWPAVARAYYADLDAVDTFLIRLHADLSAWYASPLSPEQKTSGREAVFQAASERFTREVQPTLTYADSFSGYGDLPVNNAWVLAHYRYHLDLDVMQEVFEAVDGDWAAALAVYRAAAAAAGDPFAYLREWISGRSAAADGTE